MERPCYQCGKPVEDGVAFCPNCNAPQIRVAVAENQPATSPFRPGTPDEIQPPAQPVGFGARQPSLASSPADSALHWKEALPGTLLAGVVAALAWIIPPIGYLLWPLAAGVLGVVFYHRRFPETTITRGAGARLGAMAGLFGFVLFGILTAVNLALMGSGKVREMMQQAFQQAAARNPSPEAQAMLERFMSPEGVATMLVVVVVFLLVVFTGFASLGGALGASLTRRREPRR